MRKGRVWRVIFAMLLILLMFVAILASVDNGSVVGNVLKKSGFVSDMQLKYKNIIKEALSIKVAPL